MTSHVISCWGGWVRSSEHRLYCEYPLLPVVTSKLMWATRLLINGDEQSTVDLGTAKILHVFVEFRDCDASYALRY